MSLQTNTASLTALLESVNALPDKIDTSGRTIGRLWGFSNTYNLIAGRIYRVVIGGIA